MLRTAGAAEVEFADLTTLRQIPTPDCPCSDVRDSFPGGLVVSRASLTRVRRISIGASSVARVTGNYSRLRRSNAAVTALQLPGLQRVTRRESLARARCLLVVVLQKNPPHVASAGESIFTMVWVNWAKGEKRTPPHNRLAATTSKHTRDHGTPLTISIRNHRDRDPGLDFQK